MFYIVEELVNLLGDLGIPVRLTFNLRSTALMKCIYVNRYTNIASIGSKNRHVAREEETHETPTVRP